ncbi:hypothetical protein FSP39_021466 [Pinctada imbricata]|uniref:Claudin n=1 Tax=Pinctada imbricata TaxID=66713 RepID=A0AA88YCM1_PINIB|nr:hypothetical protein FSP39_021466 [Pinctada imbricata]
MSVLDDFKGASIIGKIALILLLVASFCVCIAFTCTGWGGEDAYSVSQKTYWGLWRRCVDTNVVSPCVNLDGTPNDWWAYTQAGSCFGFFGTLVACTLMILYVFVGKCKKNGEMAIAAGIICIVTGILFLIACIVFGVKWNKYYDDVYVAGILTVDRYLSYAFGFAVVGALLEIVSGVLCIIEAKKGGGTGASG